MDRNSTTSDAPELFAGEAWFDRIETRLRDRVRGFIEEMVEQELALALGRANKRVSAFQCRQSPASIALCSRRRRFVVAQAFTMRDIDPESGGIRRMSGGRTWMKRTIFALSTILVAFVAVFALLVLYPVRKARAAPNLCPNLNETLHGNYGLVAPGNDVSTGWDFSMLANFNGSGTFNGSHVYAVRGRATVRGSDGSFGGAAYSVGSDCKFTANTNKLAVFGYSEMYLEGIVVRGGNEVIGTWQSGDQSGTFDAKNVVSY
jgi:hypothetical protein